MTAAALGVAIFASALERRQRGRGRVVAVGGSSMAAEEPVAAAHG